MPLVFDSLTPPVRILPAARLSDEEFLAFCRVNEPYRFEKNPGGEIIMMTPAGNRSDEREADLVTDLKVWARADGRGRVNGPNAGWNLADGSTRSPDASWTSNEQLDRLKLFRRTCCPKTDRKCCFQSEVLTHPQIFTVISHVR